MIKAQDFLKFVRKLEEAGCTCDLMYGYTCGIHKLVKDELKRFQKENCE